MVRGRGFAVGGGVVYVCRQKPCPPRVQVSVSLVFCHHRWDGWSSRADEVMRVGVVLP